MFLFLPFKNIFNLLVIFGVFIHSVHPQEGPLSQCEVEGLLNSLLTPEERNSLQVQALRRNLLRILELVPTEVSQNLEDPGEADDLGPIYGRIIDDKRSLSSLARSGSMPFSIKRNVEALARGGLLKHTAPEDSNSKRSLATLAKNGQLPIPQDQYDDIAYDKRNIGSAARSGYLNKYVNNYDKRNIGAAARSGYLERYFPKRNLASLARNYDLPYSYSSGNNLKRSGEDKRNVESLMRNGMMPNAQRSFYEQIKRNIGSMARDWALPNLSGKRNVAALLRQDSYLNSEQKNDEGNLAPTENVNIDEQKRNLASLKAQAKYHNQVKRSLPVPEKPEDSNNKTSQVRHKRELRDYEDETMEVSSPVLQNIGDLPNYDYEEFLQALAASKSEDRGKRFLGSVARSGWFRPNSMNLRRLNGPSKRHIGALARLGWLPSFRAARGGYGGRFSRSGRTPISRSYSKDGATEDYYGIIPSVTTQQEYSDANEILQNKPFPDNNPYPETDVSPNDLPSDNNYRSTSNRTSKRYILLPAVDNLLLRKLYPHMVIQ